MIFQNRFDCFTTPGGDTIQMIKTKEYLQKIGVSVVIDLNPNADLSSYDLVHIFNIMRPFETFLFIRNALSQNKKILMSSIYWDFEEFNIHGRDSKYLPFLYNIFDEFFIEKLKYLKRDKIIKSLKKEFVSFSFSNYRKILEKVNLFLPNSVGEGEIIKKKISQKIKYGVVYNAVDEQIFNLSKTIKRNRQAVTVARLDPRKNIIKLIQAFKVLDYHLDIYGSSSPLHLSYLDLLKSKLSYNTFVNEHVQHEDLFKLYNQFEIHILPSWLETPGLSQLEAAACGCNIVSTIKGSAPEYFGEMAYYCYPNSIDNIVEVINRKRDSLIHPKLMSEFILDNYTWDITASQTKRMYERVLNE